MKRKLAFVLALVLMLMIPLSQCQAVTIVGFYEAIKKGEGKSWLQITEDSKGQWQKVSGDKMKARFSVYNPKESTYTVKGFELYVYATDVWGDRIYGPTTYYYWTTKKNVAPGKYAYSDYCTIPNRSEVDKLHVAVKKFVYTDDDIIEIADENLKYWEWDVSWN